jgi:predicted small lipoprotein YifL
MKQKFNTKSLVLLLLVASITGCSTLTGDTGLFSSRPNNKNASNEEVNRSQVLLQAGADYLQKGDLEKAQAVFNSGLNFFYLVAVNHDCFFFAKIRNSFRVEGFEFKVPGLKF